MPRGQIIAAAGLLASRSSRLPSLPSDLRSPVANGGDLLPGHSGEDHVGITPTSRALRHSHPDTGHGPAPRGATRSLGARRVSREPSDARPVEVRLDEVV